MSYISRGKSLAATAVSLLDPAAVRASIGDCPSCGPSLLIKLDDSPIAVRCLRCRSSAIHMSLLKVVRDQRLPLAKMQAYEMSSRGPVRDFLAKNAASLTVSEYFDDVVPGEARDGVQCQDVQRLTFPDASFDLCTSTEVFEHVPDDRAGFAELRRVLRSGGKMIFTVPMSGEEATVERARLKEGSVEHMFPPEYHGDVLRGQGKVLAFRNYGNDIIQRLEQAGFAAARLAEPNPVRWWGQGVPVIIATA